MLYANAFRPCSVLIILVACAVASPVDAASPININHVGTKYSLPNAEGRAIRFSADSKSLVVAGHFKGKPVRQVAMALDRSGANLWSSEVSADFQSDRSCRTTAVAIDPNGSAIIAGPCLDEFQRFGFARFTRGGELDPTFKTTWTGFEGAPEYKGRVVHTPSEGNFYLDQIAIPYAVEIKGDAEEWRIVSAGYSGADRDSRVVVGQMYPNGELDTTFGNDQPGTGFFTSDLTSIKSAEKNTARGATALLVDDKELLVAGNMLLGNRWQAFVIRLNADGEIDTTFNDGAGIVLLPFGPDVEAKAFSMCRSGPDKERVYVGAYSRRKGTKEGWRLSAACITADGQPSSAFTGRSSTVAPSASTYDASVADPVSGPQVGVLADETVILVGQVTTSVGPTIGIVSLSPAAAWAAERPGIPTGLAISTDAQQLIAISATTASGGMTVEFYSPSAGARQARR